MMSLPEDFQISTIVPISQGKNANLTDSDNYRSITISSVLEIMFDLVVLDKYSDHLFTSDL